MIDFINLQFGKLSENIGDDRLISCHGYNNGIITSDYQLMTKQAIDSIIIQQLID